MEIKLATRYHLCPPDRKHKIQTMCVFQDLEETGCFTHAGGVLTDVTTLQLAKFAVGNELYC